MESCQEVKFTRYCCLHNFCGKGYSSKLNLKRHIQSKHSELSRFTCSICQKPFASKQNLMEHIYSHTGEKPYKCQFCSKAFRYASTLSLHKKGHKSKGSKKLVGFEGEELENDLEVDS